MTGRPWRREAFVVDAVRSPFGRGKPGGALADVHAVELLAQVLGALVERTGIDPGEVDDVLVGCVSQAGEQAGCPGRMAWLGAGLPEHVPATTIDRRCGSSQQALHFAAQAVQAGAYELAVVGGVESMSRVPMGSARLGTDAHGPSAERRFGGLISQGIAAEVLARQHGITREDCDAYAAGSHRRAAAADDDGRLAGELVPIATPPGGAVDQDETIRRGTDAATLAALRPSFPDGEAEARFPGIGGVVTAGNASQLADGAAAILVASGGAVDRLGLTARARVHETSVCGVSPLDMLAGPIPATRKVLGRAGLGVPDLDAVEVNEAFAPVPLAWLRELDVDPARVNPAGGAIAFGHPLGASGARLVMSLLGELDRTGGRYGLVTMCEGGGMANATVLERTG